MTAAPRSRRRAPSGRNTAASAVDRVMAAAYELFSRRGVRTAGVNEIIDLAGVAKATFYRHFTSKDDLIVAYLRTRYLVWGVEWLQAETRKRAKSPRDQLLAVFDVFHEWFQKGDYEGCPFVGTVSQGEPQDRVRAEAQAQLAAVRAFIRGLAAAAGLEDPSRFAWSWQLLMDGSIIMALAGDRHAAMHARSLAEAFLASYPWAG
jgi:AcrR family transcriptional regulator